MVGIGFLHTTLAYVAVAAALIPLIIHLFFRRKVKIIEFSSLKHLKAMQRRQVRKLRLRQWLLLLTRMLIVLLAVLAFARPITESDGVGSHAAVSAVVVLDNSASMDRYVRDGNLFELARTRARELLQVFGPSDEVCLMTPAGGTGPGEAALRSSPTVALEKLENIEVNCGRADAGAVLGDAVRLLDQAVNLNKEIYLITDRQQSSLPDSAVLKDANVTTFLVELPLEETDNIGVVAVDFGGQLITPGHNFDITATVRNYGEADRDDLLASLFIDGRRVAQKDCAVSRDDEAQVRFTHSVSTTGFHSGFVELSDDRFPTDNRFYFSFRIPDRFNVLIIDGDGTGLLMELALSPSPDVSQYWSVKRATADNLAGVDFWDYDVIVLAGVPVLINVYTQRLKAFVNQGRALLLTYGAATEIDHFNGVWSGVTGVTYDKGMSESFTRAGYYSFLSFDVGHPIFSVFDFEAGKVPEVKFFTLPEVHVGPEARTLAAFTGERPALVENRFGEGRVLTFNGPAAARYTDLSGHAFFVPLVSRMVEYLAADLSAYDLRLVCGSSILRTLSLKGTVAATVTLTAPDSSRYVLSPRDEQAATTVAVGRAELPGIYRIDQAAREIDRFAVNADRAECDLSSVDIDRFRQALGASDMHRLAGGTEIGSAIAELRHGKELWQVFLWVLVVVIAVEILLSRGKPAEEPS
ncbi:MAG: BatA domain-containing protein [Candidatus Zixiibacteriota bacterium]|nr:MAG: BatA domain-containing protein [candidate division Zixibacteria bacterium]